VVGAADEHPLTKTNATFARRSTLPLSPPRKRDGEIWLLDLALIIPQSDQPSVQFFLRVGRPTPSGIAFTSDRDTHPAGIWCWRFYPRGFEFLQSTNLIVSAADGGRLRQQPNQWFAGSPKWSADVAHCTTNPLPQESWESRKGSSDRDFRVANHQRRLESGDRKQTHQWTWHEGVTTVLNADRRVREKQAAIRALSSPREKKSSA